jgi:signal peptidase complex subunit 2
LIDLKNTTDDALPNYLNSLKFKQSHYLTDVRLGLGYTAIVIAAAVFYLDYKLGWDKTKDLTFWAVIVYFALNSALTLWIWGVEKGKIYTGSRDHALVSYSLFN